MILVAVLAVIGFSSTGCDDDVRGGDPPTACIEVTRTPMDCGMYARYYFSARCSEDDFTSRGAMEVRWDLGGEGDFTDWVSLDTGLNWTQRALPGRTSLVMVAEVRDSSGNVDQETVEVDLPHGRLPTPDLIASEAFVVDASGEETTTVVAGEPFTVGIRYYGWEQGNFQWTFDVEYSIQDTVLRTQSATANGPADDCEVDTAEFTIEEPGDHLIGVSLGQPAEVDEYSWYNNTAWVHLTVVAP